MVLCFHNPAKADYIYICIHICVLHLSHLVAVTALFYTSTGQEHCFEMSRFTPGSHLKTCCFPFKVTFFLSIFIVQDKLYSFWTSLCVCLF